MLHIPPFGSTFGIHVIRPTVCIIAYWDFEAKALCSKGKRGLELGLMKTAMAGGGVRIEAKAAVGMSRAEGTGTERGDSVAVGGTGG